MTDYAAVAASLRACTDPQKRYAADVIDELCGSISDVTAERDRAMDANLLRVTRYLPPPASGDVVAADSMPPPSYAEVTAYAELQNRALRSVKASLSTIHDRHVDEQESDLTDGRWTPNRDTHTVVDCNVAIDEIDAALAKNPNPSGQSTAEASASLGPEASGPVGLGPQHDPERELEESVAYLASLNLPKRENAVGIVQPCADLIHAAECYMTVFPPSVSNRTSEDAADGLREAIAAAKGLHSQRLPSEDARDAARYRYLRVDDHWGEDAGPDFHGSAWGVLGELSGSEFDAFIDERMSHAQCVPQEPKR